MSAGFCPQVPENVLDSRALLFKQRRNGQSPALEKYQFQDEARAEIAQTLFRLVQPFINHCPAIPGRCHLDPGRSTLARFRCRHFDQATFPQDFKRAVHERLPHRPDAADLTFTGRESREAIAVPRLLA